MSPNIKSSEQQPASVTGSTAELELIHEFLSARVSRRDFLAKATMLGLSASTIGFALSACGSSPTTSAPVSSKPPTKTLTWRPFADVENVDPALLPGLEDPPYSWCLFEGLITVRPGKYEVVNCLAESFEASPDGKQIHFVLKQGIPWQKGYGEVQASDVKYSFERIAGLTKPNLNSPYQGDWAALDTVRVDSKYSGTIIMKDIFAPTLTSTLCGTSGMVLPQKAIEKLGKNFGTNPVGSAPYEWTSWVPGQKLVLTKFADYGGANRAYANKNLFEEIQALPISSDESAYAALSAGTVNFCELGISTVKTARSNPSLKVYRCPGLGQYYFLAMNVTEPPLTNVWLRKAIRSAIDVPGIIDAAYDGLYTRANAIIPPWMPIGYWADAPTYNQDLSLARSYLRQSGLTDVNLRLNVDTVAADVEAAEIIGANLGQIGIKVDVVPVDPATFADIPGPGGGGPHAQLLYYIYGGQLDPNFWFEWWTCSQVGLWNWDHWCNVNFDRLLNQALGTYDVSERTRLYIEAQKLWDAEAGIVWICDSWDYIGVQPYIKPSFSGYGSLLVWNTTWT
jgi:peptide/nickel transport system substrate-binding protein